MRKGLVFGTSGMLGRTLLDYFKQKDYNVFGVTRNEFDIYKSNNDDLDKLLERCKP